MQTTQFTVQIRTFQPDIYPHLTSWYTAHSLPIPPLGAFSEATTLIAYIADIPVASITYYPQQTLEFALVDGLIADPNLPSGARRGAVDALFKRLDIIGKTLGCKALVLSTEHAQLAKRYQGLGYTITAAGCYTMSKRL